MIWVGVISSDRPSSQSPFPSFRMLFKEKVSRSICLWNNYFKHGYNTDFSSNTEEIYLAKFLSPTKNYTNISLNTTVKRTSRKNLMFRTQKEGKKKPNQTQTEKPQKDKERAKKEREGEQTQHTLQCPGTRGAQHEERARHTLSNSPGDIWSYIHQLLTLERLLLIEAVTNQMEKEAVVAREGAGFKFCKPFALHCPAPQKH